MNEDILFYEAKAFSPEAKGITYSGRITIDEANVHFSSDHLSYSLPLEGLQIRTGGYNNAQIFLEHPNFPGYTIYSTDARLTRDPRLARHPTFSKTAKQFEKGRKETPIALYFLIAFGIGILLLIGGLVLAKDPLVKFAANRIPVEWEQKIGDQLFKAVTEQGKLITNSIHQGTVDEIINRLVPAVGDARSKFVFHIMQDTNVNAFAFPGGHVVILTGLLENAGSPEEVAGVVAHEIAHVTQRHSLRSLVEKLGLVVLIQAVVGDVAGLAAILTEGSRFLLEQSFSRKYEREADNIGWDYLIAAQIDPRGMTEFFKKLSKIQEEMGMGDSAALAVLSTHPATGERIARLEDKWSKLDPKPVIKPLTRVAPKTK